MVLGGEGKSFSAGGDFNWVLTWPELDAITRQRRRRRHDGRGAGDLRFPQALDRPRPWRGGGRRRRPDAGLRLRHRRVLGAVRPDLGAQRPAGGHRHPGADRGGRPAGGAPAPDAWRHVRCRDGAAHRPGRPGRRGRRARRDRGGAGRRAEARRAVGPDRWSRSWSPRSTPCRTIPMPPTSWASTSPTSASPTRRSRA